MPKLQMVKVNVQEVSFLSLLALSCPSSLSLSLSLSFSLSLICLAVKMKKNWTMI